MYYSLDEWILLFFIYGFIGYLWEIVYCSINRGHLVNRGFLYGPILPIYGFGAVIILFCTIPFSRNLLLVFVSGLVSSTVLEFLTGAVMLKLFKVRYWDYSNEFGNIKGYICPLASFAWGLFSCLLIRYIHPVFSGFVLKIEPVYADAIAHILTIIISVDFALSSYNAFNLRRIIDELLIDENNNGIPDVLEAIPEHIKVRRRELINRISKLRKKYPSLVFDKKYTDYIKRIHNENK